VRMYQDADNKIKWSLFQSPNTGLTFDPAGNLAVTGNMSASHFVGDGSLLTGLSASALPASATLQGNAFNGANQLVQLDASGKLPGSVFSGKAALLAGDQTFTGANTFAVSPTVPAPAAATSAANKDYVDTQTGGLAAT